MRSFNMPRTASRKKASRTKGKSTSKVARHAKVVLNLADSVPVIEASENVESITEADGKVLVVHFDTPFVDELYRCDVISGDPVTWKITVRMKEGVGIQVARPWPSRIKIVCEEI
jgi:hypothetical protein